MKTIYEQVLAAMPAHDDNDYTTSHAAHIVFTETAKRLMNIDSPQLDAMRQRPVIRDKDDVLHFIRPVDIRSVAFTWDPVFGEVANGLVALTQIKTLHTWAYYGFFKPSIAEVLAQIPHDIVAKVVAFETRGPQKAVDLNDERCALNAGYHVATTTLYARP